MTTRNLATSSTLPFLYALTIVIAGTLASAKAGAETRIHEFGWEAGVGANIAGYTIHVSTEAGEMLDAIDVGLPAEESGVMRSSIELDVEVEHSVAIATYDEKGVVSALSPELTIPSDVSTSLDGNTKKTHERNPRASEKNHEKKGDRTR